MSDVDISAEAVERLAIDYDDQPPCGGNCGCSPACRDRSSMSCGCTRAAATLRALRAALDAAETDLAIARADLDNSGATSVEIAAERDAALAARDAAWRAGRDAAAEWLKMKEATSRSFGSHADAYEIAHRHIAALQPPADLAAEAPGDAVADALREAIQQAHSGIINLGLLDPDGQIEAVRLGLAIALDRDSARAGA